MGSKQEANRRSALRGYVRGSGGGPRAFEAIDWDPKKPNILAAARLQSWGFGPNLRRPCTLGRYRLETALCFLSIESHLGVGRLKPSCVRRAGMTKWRPICDCNRAFEVTIKRDGLSVKTETRVKKRSVGIPEGPPRKAAVITVAAAFAATASADAFALLCGFIWFGWSVFQLFFAADGLGLHGSLCWHF